MKLFQDVFEPHLALLDGKRGRNDGPEARADLFRWEVWSGAMARRMLALSPEPIYV